MSAITLSVEYEYPAGSKVKIGKFEVEEGEKVFISGETGSGKSTLLRILNGLIPNMYGGELKGYVSVYGREGNNKDVFLVTQHPEEQIIMDTVFDELAFTAVQYAKSANTNDVTQKLEETLRLFEKIGLKVDLHRKMQELSEGERQIVVICCALISGCKCLAFDEPFAHLHPSIVTKLLKFLKVDRTVILSEHRTEFSKFFDRVVHLHSDKKGKESKECGDECENKSKGKSEGESDDESEGRSKHDEYIDKEEKLEKIIQEIVEIKESKSKKKEKEERIKLEGSIYRGKKRVLDVSFNVESGEVVAVIGVNGSGKTTLLRCIAGFENCVGKLKVKGSIGFAFHYPAYSFFKNKVEDETKKYSDFGLSKLAKRHPHSLSGGEKRLLSIAKAMEGEVVLLDEPTAGLDRVKRLKVLRNIMREAKLKGKAVVIATHDFEIASLCDRCVELHA